MKKILIIIYLCLFSILILYIYKYTSNKYYYQNLLRIKTNNIITYGSPLRGDIYDINGNLLVTSKEVLNIAYDYNKNANINQILDILEPYLSDIKPNIGILKKYYLYLNPDIKNKLLTKDELSLYQKRKLNSTILEERLYTRITNDMLDNISPKKAYLYDLITKGDQRNFQILIKDLNQKTINEIMSKEIPGLISLPTYQRMYLYDTTLNSILGSIGNIPKEELNTYLKNGYNIGDQVGISYLEKTYEKYLKGTKNTYLINKDNSKTLIESGKKGNDLYLEIDINLQIDLENTLKEQIPELKKLKNTEYYHTSLVTISNPNSGAIKAITGITYLKDNIYLDSTIDILTKTYTMGSVIKGASQTVGYQNNLIERDKDILDSCVKLYGIKEKCSFKKLGKLNDLTALKWSSNYYQFITAIKSTGNTYHNNMKLIVTNEDFLRYRNTFKEYGLGNLTGIDILEYVGIPGTLIAPDLLLNLSIGQYDTYTPISLTQYINTIAMSGKRYQLSLMHQIKKGDEVILEHKPTLLNEVNINPDDMKRIREGFRMVLDGGTGRGYIKLDYKPAGKTGTSETFIDTDGDFYNDTKTITETSAMYFPYDNPKYSIVIISPNSSHYQGKTDYIAPINSKISKIVTKNMFENY